MNLRKLELYRRYLDRELDTDGARELETLLGAEGAAPAELAAYREMAGRLRQAPVPAPTDDFAARVMRRLPPLPRRLGLRELVLRPRLSLAGAAGLAVLVVCAWLPLRELARSGARPVASTQARTQAAAALPPAGTVPSQVVVRFVLPAKGARRVALAGDFNGWRTDEILLQDERGDGVFSTTVALPPGRHGYLFFVDGRWVQDPGASLSVPDGFGQRNSLLDL